MVSRDRRGRSESVVEPEVEDAVSFLRTGLSGSGLVVAVGDCRVEYEGRASSLLDWGERVVLVKPDGSLLVHQTTGSDPANWMPPGSSTRVESEGDAVVLRSRSTSPREHLEAWFRDVQVVVRSRLVDGVDLRLRRRERDMKDEVVRDPGCIEEGFRVVETERESAYGRVDVFGRDSEGRPVVVELKRKTAGAETVDQLGRYVEDYRRRGYGDVRGVLAAPSVSDGARERLRSRGFEHVELEPSDVVPERTTKLDEFA
ncbi:MAG: endonuclease NucS [Halobacteriales archaeon]